MTFRQPEKSSESSERVFCQSNVISLVPRGNGLVIFAVMLLAVRLK